MADVSHYRINTTAFPTMPKCPLTKGVCYSSVMPADSSDVEGQTSSSTDASGLAKPTWQIMGLDATPELLAIFLVYFVQGILGLSRLAVSFYFKDELHMDPAELAIFSGLSTLPWLIKPLYGFVSDTFPLFGYRRRYVPPCRPGRSSICSQSRCMGTVSSG